METRLKQRLSRIIQTSFNSCRNKNISDDVTEQPFFFPENQHYHRQLIDLFSPKPQPYSSSLCKPKKLPQPAEIRPKISDKTTLLLSSTNTINNNGQRCLPVSPTTPLTNNIFNSNNPKKSRNHKTRSRNHKTNRKSQTQEFFAPITANYYGSSWYSSDEDEDNDYDDQTTLFSSRSLSSDTSGSFRKHKARLADKRRKNKDGRNRNDNNAKAVGVVPVEGNGGVTDSFAVVKKSNDPHDDFRTSMVEMIVEKQIFGAQELENLLQCFLNLNSDQHHCVIVQVFTEILEVLFSDSC